MGAFHERNFGIERAQLINQASHLEREVAMRFADGQIHDTRVLGDRLP